MLVAGLPALALIALAIKVDDGGPIFYRQKRWGRDASIFSVFKFRTMVPDSDARFGILPSKEDDMRITRVGRFLRKTGLDELPQVINIVRGEMSFVGPRPLAEGELLFLEDRQIAYDQIEGFHERLSAPPGLTGPATVFIPKDSSPQEKFELDLEYVRNWSFRTDVRLIVLSFLISIRGKWETRAEKTRRLRA